MRLRDYVLVLGALALASCSPPQEKEAPPPAPAGEDAHEGEIGRAITNPAAVVSRLYDQYMMGSETTPPLLGAAPWSAQMSADLTAMMARSQAQGEPILDFDPIVNAQDFQVGNVSTATEAMAENSHAVVRASFNNNGQPQQVIYDLVWQDDRWMVDNIRTADWDLRAIATGG